MTVARPLRKDAERNRTRILATARTMFAEAGPDVPMEDIAASAGVGIATLYRRFPSREHLLVALLVERMEELAEAARSALEYADPWEGLTSLMRQGTAIQARDVGFIDLARRRIGGVADVVAVRSTVMTLLGQVVSRAKGAGVLRADLEAEDLPILMFAAGDATKLFSHVAPRLWERNLAVIIDGMRAGATAPMEHPPLTSGEFEAAFRVE
jgi:AcrR family transcriptional regulator